MKPFNLWKDVKNFFPKNNQIKEEKKTLKGTKKADQKNGEKTQNKQTKNEKTKNVKLKLKGE